MPPLVQYLTILYQHDSMTFEGENLHQLLDLLQDQKIRKVEQFNPKQHRMPDDGEPVIQRIFWKKLEGDVGSSEIHA